MASSMMMLGVTIKMFDQMSGGMGNIVRQVDGFRGKLKQLSDQASALGRGALGTGLIAGGTLSKPVAAFAALEDASTRLKAVMMDKNGTTGAFEKVNALAVKLGDQLPGTTADFLNMMAAMKAQGLSDDSILGGVGESAAKMAVLLKKTPEDMAVFAAKLKTAMGIADGDMLAFMDTIQRTYFMGVDATEMMYAFGRSAGALKTIKQQGLEAGRALAPLYAMWVKGGMTGETVGTGFASMTSSMLDAKKVGKANALLQTMGLGPLKFTDKKGNFAGIENMIQQLDGLKTLDASRLNAVLKELFGGGQDQSMAATLVTNGVEGYRKQVAAMEAQADLNRRIAAVLRTLTNLWEAASGTFENLLASFGEAVGDDLKALAEAFGTLSAAVKGFVEKNPTLAQWVGRLAIAFTGLMLGGGSLLILTGLIGKAVAGFMSLGPAVLFSLGALAKMLSVMSAVGAFMLANPITIAITFLALAAKLIYDNWAPIKEFFVDLWDGIKNTFAQALEWIGSKMQSLSDLMPDWMKKYTLPGAAVQFMGDKLGPARPAATAPPGQANVGGQINIKVEGEVKSIHAKSNNAKVPLNFDAGPMAVGY